MVRINEVYGSLGDTGYFTEITPYDPQSPYSASKAGSDHLVMAYHHTYGLPVTLSNCSNNYGSLVLRPSRLDSFRQERRIPAVYGEELQGEVRLPFVISRLMCYVLCKI